jgi:YHS domain-containing protein
MHETTHEHDAEAQIDPVCGMTVNPADRPDLHLEHEGRTYWFCGKGCLLEFRDAPGTFTAPGYQPQGM